MKLWIPYVALVVLAGCSATPEPEQSSKIEPGAPTVSPTAAAPGVNASEWLMNTKHTLTGMDSARAIAFLEATIKVGAVEVQALDIQPDPADPSYLHANKLAVVLPIDKDSRLRVISFVSGMQGGSMPVADTGQKSIEVPLPLPEGTER
jgi:hypothetical protein